MSDSLRRESPLVRLDLRARDEGELRRDASVVAAERAFVGHLNLRGNPENPRFVGSAQAVLDLPLPLEPNTVTRNEAMTAFWLGPDEWLVLTPGEQEQEVAESLRHALAETVAAVTEIGGGQTIIAVEGRAARDLLSRGCFLDFHPRAFQPGCCAQTLFGKSPILVWQVNETPRFELVVRRSFAEYVWNYIVDASRVEDLCILSGPD